MIVIIINLSDFSPTTGFRSIDTPFPDVLVFREKETASPTTFVPSGTKVYEKLDLQSGVLEASKTETGTRIVAGSTYLGETLYVFNKFGIHTSTSYFDKNEGVNFMQSHVVLVRDDPDRIFTEPPSRIPPLGSSLIDVYLNGNKCVEGLDTLVSTIRDGDGHIASIQTSPISVNYVSEDDRQRVDSIFYSGTDLTNEAHFTFEGKVSYDQEASFWIPSLGRLFVNGVLQHDIEEESGYFEVGAPDNTGDPYHLLVSVVGSLGDVFSDFSEATDKARFDAIQTYLGRVTTVDKSFILLNTKYQVFSPTMNEIMRYALDLNYFEDGLFVNDPDDALQREQVLSIIPDIFADHTLESDTDIFDRKYLDVVASYFEGRSGSIEAVQFVNRVLRLILPSDPHARGDAY